MNTSKQHKAISGLLVLLSFTSLALLHFSFKPPGIAGVAYADLLNSGRIPEIHALISSAERHRHLLPYEQLSLFGVLILIALFSIFNFRLSGSGESK